jgi:hypothetical protein
MSSQSQAVFFFISLICFVVAAIVAWVVAPRQIYSTLIAAGLAAWVFVAFWSAVEAS